MRFMSLASGSNGNCYYIETEGAAVIIDAGIGGRTIKKRLSTAGVDMNSVMAVLVTHDHSDHIKGVGSLSEIFGKPVYSTEGILENMNKNYRMNPKVSPASKRLVRKGEKFSLGDMEITAFPVPHDASDSVGYRIDCDGKSLALVTDAGVITDEIVSMVSDVDYLVIESNYDEVMLENGPYPLVLRNRITSGNGHLSNKQCAEFFCVNELKNLKKVFLCHLSAHNNTANSAFSCVRRGLDVMQERVGHDIDLKVLPRLQPTEMFSLY